jgi:alginate production protein
MVASGLLTTTLGMMWSTALAGWDAPVAVGKTRTAAAACVPARVLLALADLDRQSTPRGSVEAAALPATPSIEAPGAAPRTDEERSSLPRDARTMSARQLAQFQLPEIAPGQKDQPKLPSQLRYQYSYSTETTMTYQRDRDLDTRLRDNSNIFAPNFNGVVIYRPTNWLETTLELILEREIALQEEDSVTLPSGEVVPRKRRRNSLLIDQAFVTIREVIAPFELTIGRRNYEDDRRTLYDTSMDMVNLSYKQGLFRAQAMLGREHLKNLELAPRLTEAKDQNDTFIFYSEYRGIEDVKLAGYFIARHDRAGVEGKPRLLGVRALGTPSEALSYWAEVGYLGGKDPAYKTYAGRAYDVGLTYRFKNLPFWPNVTVGHAFGSGDDKSNPTKNFAFRRSGLHSNEWRFAGIPQFKVFGEVLDPDLSNIDILTLGLGFRPASNASLDFVYHRYRLDKIAAEIHGWGLTAEMNQVDTRPSKNVGSELDIVLGLRNLFGVKRLGLDVRLGWFFPGDAFVTNVGTDQNPMLRPADKSVALVAKLWW